MGGVFVVAAFLRLALATGMGGVNTVGPAILVEVAPSALGSWSFFLCVHLLAESVEFFKYCGHNRVAGAGAGGRGRGGAQGGVTREKKEGNLPKKGACDQYTATCA